MDIPVDVASESGFENPTGTAASELAGSPEPTAPEPALAPQVDIVALQDRLLQAERRYHELASQLQPMARGPQQQQAPRITREQLLSDPNVGVAELLAYIEQQSAEVRGQSVSEATAEGRRAAAEQRARGMYSAAALGQGNDYDTVKQQFVQPLYDRNPQLQQLIHSVVADPADGEYLVGWINKVATKVQKQGGDMVALIKQLNAALDGTQDAAADTARRVTSESVTQAQRLLSGRSGASGTSRGKPPTADDIWKMSGEDFRRLAAANGQSV